MADEYLEKLNITSLAGGVNRDDIENFLTRDLTRPLMDYVGGESGYYEFVTNREFRETYFQDLAKKYYDKDKTGDPMARVLNTLYDRGETEAINRMADVIAERLRPKATERQTQRDLENLLENQNQPPQPVNIDPSANVTQGGQDIRKRRGASLLSSIRAGETGEMSGRPRDNMVKEAKGLLGTTKDALGTYG